MNIQIKTVPPLLTVLIEGKGKIVDFNQDIDRLYRYLYQNNFQDYIAGPTIGLFYSKSGGKYIAAVPIKEAFPTEGDIKIKKLPKIKCASIIHKGSWKTIDQSFNKIFTYLKENNLQWRFPVREIYLKCEGREEEYLTEIQIPIK